MAVSFTPTLLVATVGLLKNNGLGINSDLIAEVEKFNTNNVSGSLQNRFANDSPGVLSNPALFQELARVPSFLTGIIPDGIISGSRTTYINIPQAILDQGKSLFRPAANMPPSRSVSDGFPVPEVSVATYIHIYNKATEYAQKQFSLFSSLYGTRDKVFDDLGFVYKNYADVISGGVTNQFDVAGVPDLASELQQLGSMFDTADLSQVSKPTSVARSLINQGLGYINGLEAKIAEQEIDLTDEFPDDTAQKKLKNIFATIKGSDLQEVFDITGFNAATRSEMSSLADVFDIYKLLTPKARVALGANPSLDGLANKMSNLGGKYDSLPGFGSFLSSLDLRNISEFPDLQKLNTLLPIELTDSLNTVLGKGTGIFGNPTMNDMISSASGHRYIEIIKSINEIQSHLVQYNGAVSAFKSYLDTAPALEAGAVTGLVDAILATVYLDSRFEQGEKLMRQAAESLIIEKDNLNAAGVRPGTVFSNNLEIINFAVGLHELGRDSTNIGSRLQVLGTVQPGETGDAIRACIVEGKNLVALQSYGIDPGIKIDPMEFALKLVNSNQ